MPAARPIVIAGAGIGGLTLALSLAKRGISSLIVERAPKLEEIGAGLQISPNASRVLDQLGLGPEVDEAGIQPGAIKLIGGRSGKILTELKLGFSTQTRWGAPYRLIHRARLQTILARAAVRNGLSIRLGTELADFAETGGGVVVHLRSPVANETVAARGLIGADGVRSLVRTRMGGGDLRFSGQVAWRATLPAGGGRDTQLWLGPGAHLVTYPLDRSGLLNIVAVTHGEHPGDGWARPGDPDNLMRAFETWVPGVKLMLGAAPEWLTWPLYDSTEPVAWSKGPVTLIGDAAHPVLPHLAQGAAMAIEDAAVLAARIADAPRNIERAFRAYEAERTARTTRVQKEARRNGEIYRLGGLAAKARDFVLGRMSQESLAARFDWLYGYRAQ